MDFKNANELLTLCEEKNLPVSEVMRIREIELGETSAEIVNEKMTRVLEIMKDAAFSPIKQPVKSMGGLIGGEARKLSLHAQEKKGLCGDLLQKAITYAMATLETNASMGLIVASPTASAPCCFLSSMPFSNIFCWLSSTDCRFCRNRTGTDAGNAGTLSFL